MVVTADPELAEKVRILRNHGMKPKYYHQWIGINGRLDALQAAVLRVKLKYLEGWTQKRRRNAARYRSLFARLGMNSPQVVLPEESEDSYHIYNQFVIRVKNRDALREFLARQGIGTEI